MLKDFTLSIPFLEHYVLYLCLLEEKLNLLLKISGNWLFKDLLTNKQSSIDLFSRNLIMLDSENREPVCNFNILVGIPFEPGDLLSLIEDIMKITSLLSVGAVKKELKFSPWK